MAEHKPLMKVKGWMLIDSSEVSEDYKSLLNAESFRSFMYHDCGSLMYEYKDEEADGIESEVRYLDAEDSIMGKCWYCMAEAPQELITVWKIHNFNIINDIPDPFKDSWCEKYLQSRLQDIQNIKEAALNAKEE